jgi:hypothetical protein
MQPRSWLRTVEKFFCFNEQVSVFQPKTLLVLLQNNH